MNSSLQKILHLRSDRGGGGIAFLLELNGILFMVGSQHDFVRIRGPILHMLREM